MASTVTVSDNLFTALSCFAVFGIYIDVDIRREEKKRKAGCVGCKCRDCKGSLQLKAQAEAASIDRKCPAAAVAETERGRRRWSMRRRAEV